MIKSVWNMNGLVRMQAEIVEEYNNTLIYTLKGEEKSMCIEINNALLRIGFLPYDLPALKNLIDNKMDFPTYIKDKILIQLESYANNESGSWLNFQWANAVGMHKEAKEARSKREAIRLRIKEDEAAKEVIEALERVKREEEALVINEERFRAGESISADQYKNLLIKHGIWSEVPIKTKGWINTNLVSIHLDGCRCKTKIAKGNRLAVSKSKSVWDSLSMLKAKLEITE